MVKREREERRVGGENGGRGGERGKGRRKGEGERSGEGDCGIRFMLKVHVPGLPFLVSTSNTNNLVFNLSCLQAVTQLSNWLKPICQVKYHQVYEVCYTGRAASDDVKMVGSVCNMQAI